jgi:hypothetical protein
VNQDDLGPAWNQGLKSQVGLHYNDLRRFSLRKKQEIRLRSSRFGVKPATNCAT